MTNPTTLLTIAVSGSDELNSAIKTANNLSAGGSLIINVQRSFKLTKAILPINMKRRVSLTIEPTSGKQPLNLDGQNSYNGFVILNGIVKLTNLNLQHMKSSGQSGCMGAGAGLFIANTSNMPNAKTSYTPVVTLTNVSFTNCAAQGGDWADKEPGGQYYYDKGGVGGAGSNDGNGYYGNNGEPGFNPRAGAGYFGIVGSGGGGGNNDCTSPGGSGGISGYGAGCSGGGGGGGGMGGPRGGESGGSGASGGAGGAQGFGGTPPDNSSLTGKSGDPSDFSDTRGGNGGRGGNGAHSGAGAGFGGAIFAMDNAAITFIGQGSMSSNQAVGGRSSDNSSASGVGRDIFMQGSGTLSFDIPSDNVYTMSGGISDETGAVKNCQAKVVIGTQGPDGLPTGGGTGVWNINKKGKGKLSIGGENLLSGTIKASEGAIDLSHSNSRGGHSILLEDGSLLHKPKNAELGLGLKVLSVSDTANLTLSGYSRLMVEQLVCPAGTLHITLDPDGFTTGIQVPLITSVQLLDRKIKVIVSTGYSCEMSEHKITVTKTS